MKDTSKPLNAHDHGQPAIQPKNRLVRRKPSPMALEQRFMFDGAAVAEAVDTVTQPTEAASTDRLPHLLDIVATDSQPTNTPLIAAQAEAERLIGQFLNSPDAQAQLFALFHGTGDTDPGAAWQAAFEQLMSQLREGDGAVRVELRSASELQGAKGAFATSGSNGEPTIYLNADWLAGSNSVLGAADSAAITKVLVEELGHYLDAVLNSGIDTAGDEGEQFARVVVDGAAPAELAYLATQDDHGSLTLDGRTIEAEFANFTFANAYEMVYDQDNSSNSLGVVSGAIDTTERWADKEQNSHFFDATRSLGQVRVEDGSGNINFSGNDVSATSIVIGGNTYYGWISRPIKANGVVRGFYFWTDTNFTNFATAQADGNQDGDSNILDNRGFLLVVDQAWFDTQISGTGTSKTINNLKDGNLGTINVANVGSSSDRVDASINSLIVPNSAPAAANDSLTVNEDSGTTTVSAANGLLANDTDANNHSLTVTSFSVGGVSTTVAPTTGGSYTIPGVGALNISANGSYAFTPQPNYYGPVPPVTYTVSDGNGGTATAVLSITVSPVNDAPTATDDSITTPENTPRTLTLNDFGTYSDPESDPLAKLQITQLASNGTLQYWNGSAWTAVTLNQEITVAQILQGQLRFAPDANENGSNYATVRFKVSDGQTYSTNAYTLTVNVTAGNQAPTAVADTNTVTEAGYGVTASPATGNVLTDGTDDSDPESQALTVASITVDGYTKAISGSTTIKGLYGTLTINASGAYSYALDNSIAAVDAMNTGNTKTETFSYTVTDGTGNATTTLTLTINGTNDAPVAVDDFSTFVEETNASAGNHGTVTGNALTNDTDVDNTNANLTVALIDGSTPTSTLITTFKASSPITSVTATASDAGGSTWASTLPSTLSGPVYVSFDNKATWTLATEADGGNLLVKKDSPSLLSFSDNVALYAYQTAIFKYTEPSGANPKTTMWTVALTNPVTSSGTNVYTTSSNIGNIQLNDVVTWTGMPANTVVKVANINASTGEITLDRSVQLTDVTLTFSRESVSISSTQEYYQGTYGYLILNQNGGYTYTLTSDLTASQVITEQFTYTVKDPANATDTGLITVRVTGTAAVKLANDTLVVSEDSGAHVTFNGNAGNTAGDTLKTNDLDGTSITLGDIASFKVAGDATTYAAGNTATIAGVGTLSIAASGTIAFDPVDGYLGPVPTITYTRTGSDTLPYTANLTISIQAVDNPSALVADTKSVPEDTTATGNVLVNDTDVDSTLSITQFTVNGVTTTLSGGTGSYTINGVGTLTLTSNGNYSFVPAANWHGNVPAITYTTNTSASSTLSLTVTPVNDPPTLDLDGDNSSTATGSDFKQAYTNGAASVPIADVDRTIADIDDSNIENAVIVLTNPQSGDALTVGTLPTGITATTTSSGGVITVTLSGSASLADYQSAIEAITFGTTGYATAERVVSVQVNDGDVDSNIAYTTIAVSPDARPLTVTGTTVNEASPYVQFQVGGASGQWLSLALGETGNTAGHADLGTDFLPNLQYFNGSNWVDYTGGPVQIPNGSSTLLVRTPVLQDLPYEGAETLKLTATNRANAAVSGNSTIIDDGSGDIYLGNNNTATPNNPGDTDPNGPDYPSMLDDDRPITVNNIAVNEGSPYAVLTISGYAGQAVSLVWVEGSAKRENSSAPLATDGSEDFGPALQYWDTNTSQWTNYNGTSVTLAGTTLLVRTQINPDNVFEQQETFNLAVTKLSNGNTTYGRVDIHDDGTTGVKYPGTVTGGVPDTDATNLDDDRPTLSINDVTVEEGSQAAFNVTLSKPTSADVVVSFALTPGTADSSDYDSVLSHLIVTHAGGTLTPDAFGRYTIPAGVLSLTVKVATTADNSFEGGQTFVLSADVVDAAINDTDTGTATIRDDGTVDGDDAGTTPDDDRSLSVSSISVNEGSPYGVFTVTAHIGQTLTLALGDGTATNNTGNSSATDGSVDFGPSLQYSTNGGGSWTTYSGAFVVPGTGTAATSVLVRTGIINDTPYENSHNFTLTAAYSSGLARSANGTASILDDGTGQWFDGTSGTGSNTAPLGQTLDDDRSTPTPPVVTPPVTPPLPPVTPPPAPPPPAPAPVVTPPPEPPPAPSTTSTFTSTVPPSTSPVAPPPPGNPVISVVQDQVLTQYTNPPSPISDIYTSNSGFRAVVMEAPSPNLTVYRGIADQYADAGASSSFAVPYDAFAHTDPNERVLLSAKQSNGQALPKWVEFDPMSGKFSVTPPDDYVGELKIQILARDSQGREVSTLFRFSVGAKRNLADGRPGFSEQLRHAANRPGLAFATRDAGVSPARPAKAA